jgi:3-oxoacyl-[acyl-carrier-protein] synthase II
MVNSRPVERVVVTGMGVASPLGCTLPDFWGGLLSGRSGVTALEKPGFEALPSRMGAQVCGYVENEHFDRKELRRTSRASQLAIVAGKQAITQAGLEDGGADPQQVGVMIGSSIGGFSASEPFYQDFFMRGRASPLSIPISMNMAPSANLSIRYRFQGPLLNVDAACASAAHAVAHAYHQIRSGMLEVALTGGTDSPLTPGIVAAWGAMRALSERNEEPDRACRPFSADRDGLVLGEGAAVLVLESEGHAQRHGKPILAEILGYGASADSYHLTQPTQEGPALSMLRALESAGMDPRQIDAINAHGTGTVFNDRNETAAIKEVFKEHAFRIPVISNKAALGHSIAASGALELVCSICMIREGRVPPTINYAAPDPDCDLDYVVDGPRQHPVGNVLSNSFAFGGSNAALIVGKYQA